MVNKHVSFVQGRLLTLIHKYCQKLWFANITCNEVMILLNFVLDMAKVKWTRSPKYVNVGSTTKQWPTDCAFISLYLRMNTNNSMFNENISSRLMPRFLVRFNSLNEMLTIFTDLNIPKNYDDSL